MSMSVQGVSQDISLGQVYAKLHQNGQADLGAIVDEYLSLEERFFIGSEPSRHIVLGEIAEMLQKILEDQGEDRTAPLRGALTEFLSTKDREHLVGAFAEQHPFLLAAAQWPNGPIDFAATLLLFWHSVSILRPEALQKRSMAEIRAVTQETRLKILPPFRQILHCRSEILKILTMLPKNVKWPLFELACQRNSVEMVKALLSLNDPLLSAQLLNEELQNIESRLRALQKENLGNSMVTWPAYTQGIDREYCRLWNEQGKGYLALDRHLFSPLQQSLPFLLEVILNSKAACEIDASILRRMVVDLVNSPLKDNMIIDSIESIVMSQAGERISSFRVLEKETRQKIVKCLQASSAKEQGRSLESYSHARIQRLGQRMDECH